MKAGYLSLLGILAFGVPGKAASEFTSLDNCTALNPDSKYGHFPNQKPKTVQKMINECRKCRQRGVCKDPTLRDDLDYNHFCGCLAQMRRRPVFVIASGVNNQERVTWALKHGANAFELGVGPRGQVFDQWYTLPSKAKSTMWADQATSVIPFIAQKVREGHHVAFVWLEICWPDFCDVDDKEEDSCSLVGLMKLVREHLTPVKVPVLFSFYEVGNMKALNYTRNNLGPLDALSTPGTAVDSIDFFKGGKLPKPRQRIMSHAFWREEDDTQEWEEELTAGVRSQAFQKVFTWINTENDDYQGAVGAALESGVDGIAYGFGQRSYQDWPPLRIANGEIKSAIHDNPLTRLARRGDKPW
ncbi:hypothetical protein CP532_0717 [Ophiocordyceps camponoti-leonardi (nom. inval.)]|nr:hypothetical protein CP532_0717 [Ophiocordyceps camponoti-leonardi (nom. inval.)]